MHARARHAHARAHVREFHKRATFPFLQDTQDPNPLVRALAVRTMGCIRVDKIVGAPVPPAARRSCNDAGLGGTEGAEEGALAA